MLVEKAEKTYAKDRRKKSLFLIVSAVLLCAVILCAAVPVYAKEVPDINRRGSVRIAMYYGDTAVGGGTLTLYRVGAVTETDGDYNFAEVGDFAGYKGTYEGTLGENLSAESAQKLAQYVSDNHIAGITQTIGSDGSVVFSDLETGLYLLIQENAADGYKQVMPFLVSLPLYEDGTYVYNVDASPKVELEKSSNPAEPSDPDIPKEPSKPEEPTTPGEPNVPAEPTLPKTGQLNWPIPVLAVLGVLLFAAGWALRSDLRRNAVSRDAG